MGVEVREKATALLNQHLADATDLYSQTKRAHWNVKGMQFFQYKRVYQDLMGIDHLCARVLSAGG